jgi:hypothetical protein
MFHLVFVYSNLNVGVVAVGAINHRKIQFIPVHNLTVVVGGHLLPYRFSRLAVGTPLGEEILTRTSW